MSPGPRTADSWFEVKKLNESVYGIAEPGHWQEVICYLVTGANGCLLVDTGMGFFDVRKAIAPLVSMPPTVINTHSHFDHVGGNADFTEIHLYNDSAARACAEHGIAEDFLKKEVTPDQFWGVIPDGALPYVIRPFPHAQFVGNGKTFSLPPYEFTAIHTPGHTDDSICLYEPTQGWLFAGDLLYDGPIFIEKNGGLEKFKKSLECLHRLKISRIFGAHNSVEFSLEQFQCVRKMASECKEGELIKKDVDAHKLSLSYYDNDHAVISRAYASITGGKC